MEGEAWAYFNCLACHRVAPHTLDEKKCPLCDSTNGEIIDAKRLDEVKAGAFWNIDPETGKRAKKKK